MKHKKKALFQSLISLLLCFSMLVGTTFAWFTDGVSSGTNMIAAGNLDIEMEYLDADGSWKKVDENTEVLDKKALWEPGYTEVAYLKISNAGNLALKYALGIGVLAETGSVNIKGEEFKLSEHIRFGLVESEAPVTYADRMTARNALTTSKAISEGYSTEYTLNQNGDVRYVALVVYMPEEVGNAANYATGATPPEIKLGIELVATQADYESDSFGTGYDTDAEMPGFSFPQNVFGDNTSSDVTTDDENKVATGITIEGANTNAVIPAGVQLEEGTEKLTLEVTSMNQSGANVTLSENEAMRSLNVHVQGVSADNTVPMEIYIKEAAAKGLNAGNLKLYHVENGATVEMTAVDTFTAHNQFKYDPATGDITLYMATFSEIAVVAHTVNPWNGDVAAAFSGGSGTATDPYLIANADQLAYLNEFVSSDNGAYNAASYKLLSDIVFAGETSNEKQVWYPIGYHAKGSGANKAGESVWYTYGGAFSGVFDGAGHKVSNIYQNTWIMDGNYDNGYWKEAMGLFGYVYGGTVKNLTIDNFYSEGEFAPTGCVAAYAANATFENIAITSSHPQTYNTSVAAVVGRDGKNGLNNNNTYNLVFRNITVDSTNTVSALWGSWDVGAAGVLGYLGSDSKVLLENCRVSPTIDVYNDVCGNYQYYWYRYCGMLIGTVDKTLSDGSLDLSNITAKNCTVDFGNRHEYYYCEFVENSIASYTHDYQFSRVNNSDIVGSGENATCQGHNHDEEGTEVIDGKEVLVEDKQAVYIPFRQIFGGYGWGVKGTEITEDGIEIDDITVDWTTEPDAKDQVKFESKFTGDFLYRVGNANTVSVGSLFAAIDEDKINDSGVYVRIDKLYEDADVTCTYTPAAEGKEWTEGTLQFVGTGVVDIVIQDYDYCTPTILKLEVVDATNAISATSATKNNVVLLNDCGFSSLEVSGGYTLYGNGFTMTCGNDSASLSFGAFVNLDNGTLDNVQIVCPNYDFAALYNNQLTGSGNRSETTDKTRYYNAKSAVVATGNSQILNSRISGGRAALYASNGNIVVDNTRLEGGAVATVLISAANSFVFRDATLIQKPTTSTYDSEKTLMGMSVLYLCDASGNATPTTLEGSFVQNAWVDSSCTSYMPEGTSSIASTVLGKTNYTHTINGKTCVNLGFAYMPNDGTTVNQPSNITDNRDNKGTVPYDYESVSASVPVSGFSANISTYVYSYKNTSGTDNSFNNDQGYVPDKYSDIIEVSYADAKEGLTSGKSYGTNGWVYELSVDLDKASGYALDFSKMSMTVNGVTVDNFQVNNNAKPTSPVTVTAGATTYKLTTTVDGKEYTATYIVTGVETSKKAPELIKSTWANADHVTGKSGTDNVYSVTAKVLEGLTIRYWSVKNSEYVDLQLSDLTPTDSKGKINGTEKYWTVSDDDKDYTLTVTSTSEVHDGKDLFAMPVVYNNALYFVVSDSSGMVKTSNGARSMTIEYEFTDNNGGKLTFSHTWSGDSSAGDAIAYADITSDGSESDDGSCVTPETLVTLADGTKKEIQYVTYEDKLLVWDFHNATYAEVPASIIWNHGDAEYRVISLNFDDGTVVEMINSHGFFDVENNNFVYITEENVESYIGHSFVKVDGDSYTSVKLIDYSVDIKYTGCYSLQSAVYNNFMVENMLSMTTPDYEGWFDYFNINDDMKYDEEHMQSEIEKYGLTSYDEVSYLGSYELYVALNARYLNILIGRGVVTMDEVIEMLQKIS